MTQLGKYILHEELGHGGYATVYRATHSTLGSQVALKVLSPALAGDENARQRFTREAQTASTLVHPNIVSIQDLDEENSQVFIAMEYISGGDLRQHSDLSQKDLLRVLAQVAAALDFAHAKGVWHRDVKPANILLAADGSAHLCDFGLVRVAEAPRLTQLGSVVGTATYISPEQAESKPLDGRADQYSLAVVAYEYLVGEPPFKGESSTATALLHVTRTPPDPRSLKPGLPLELGEVLLKGLAKDPAGRYASCSALVQALQVAVEASQRRQYRELLAEARAFLADGRFVEMRERMDAARRLLLDRPDMQEALAELEAASQTAQTYEQMQRSWELARQKAAGVLEQYPAYPDLRGAFPTLGLRQAPFKLPVGRELLLQVGLGLLLGLPALALIWQLAFRWITRP